MKALIILVIFLALGLIFFIYKRESNTQKMLFSLFILASIIGLSIMGNSMRSLLPLFLAHIMALILSYLGLIYYIFTLKKQWIFWLLPVGTVILYLLFAWLGNEDIIEIF